jgi:hypothetical protein
LFFAVATNAQIYESFVVLFVLFCIIPLFCGIINVVQYFFACSFVFAAEVKLGIEFKNPNYSSFFKFSCSKGLTMFSMVRLLTWV